MEIYLRWFLINLAFLRFSVCLNETVENEGRTEYLQPLKRFKRILDYTRWRMDAGTTEFIVKVLDDEIGTSKKVMAVNIDDATSEKYNVVVAGAMIPSPTPADNDNSETKEYTRFVPPTTVPALQKEGDLSYLSPIRGPLPTTPSTSGSTAVGIADIFGLDSRNPQRDDSPPSGPQFVSRQLPGVVHQVAPLDPTSNQRIPTEKPLKPGHTKSHKIPPRTTRMPDMYAPSRKTTSLSEFFSDFVSMQEGEEKYMSPSILHPNIIDIHRTTTEDYRDIERTTGKSEIGLKTFGYDKEDDDEKTTENIFKLIKKYKGDDIFDNLLERTESNKISMGKEAYSTTKKECDNKPRKESNDVDTYDMMFYKDDDVVKADKKDDDSHDDTLRDYDEKIDSSATAPTRTSYAGYYVTNFTSQDEYYEAETRKPPGIQLQTDDKEKEVEKDIKVDPDTKEKVDSKENLNDDNASIKQTIVIEDTPVVQEKARDVCNVIKLRTLNFNSARTLYEIHSQLEQWSITSPMVHRYDITQGNLTVMENPINMLVVDDPTSGQTVAAKMTVMVVAGISGRDHHAVSAAMYFLYQLIERSESHADLLSKYRFWVIPVFNPDGYEYSITFPQRRQWVKNLQQYWDDCKKGKECESCALRGIRCTLKPCYGVNLDRNFEYQWIPPEELQAEHPCGTLYAGERQLSEPETKALAKFFHEQTMTFYAFITFKEGDVLGVMYPYSHTKNKRTFDTAYRQRALRAASAAYSISGRPYVAGQTSEFLPLYAGGIEDWVDGHLGIDNVYTIMMFRATDTYNPRLTMERVVHEAYAALDTLLLQSTQPASPVVVLTKNYACVIEATNISIITAIIVQITALSSEFA